MSVNPVPSKYNTVSSYMFFKDAQAAMKFYAKAFGAEHDICLSGPGGQGILHAEMRIGNSIIMVSDENPRWGTQSAETLGGSPMSLHLYVEDCDALFDRAVEAGCTVIAPMDNQFWGDRMGKVSDPFGYQWAISSQVEALTPEEIGKRGEEWMQQMMGGA